MASVNLLEANMAALERTFVDQSLSRPCHASPLVLPVTGPWVVESTQKLTFSGRLRDLRLATVTHVHFTKGQLL